MLTSVFDVIPSLSKHSLLHVDCTFCLPSLVVPRPPCAEAPLVFCSGQLLCSSLSCSSMFFPFGCWPPPRLPPGPSLLSVLGSLVYLLREALSEARSGMISALTSSSCSLKHEGYHRGRKSCPVLYVPAWLAARGNLHSDMLSAVLSILLFLWRSSIAIGCVTCAS